MSVWVRLFKLYRRAKQEKYGHLSFIILSQKEEMYKLRKCICRMDNENRELKGQVLAQPHGSRLITNIEREAEIMANRCYD